MDCGAGAVEAEGALGGSLVKLVERIGERGREGEGERERERGR